MGVFRGFCARSDLDYFYKGHVRQKLLSKLTDAERAALYDQLGAKLNDPYARKIAAAAAMDYNKLSKKMNENISTDRS